MKHFSLSATARSYPALPYESIKNDILGRNYDLSLVFVGPDRARTLNQTYRRKSYIPNVLSFPLSESTGEIYITPTVARTEARQLKQNPKAYIGYLFIHGLLHLKGFAHGPKMERLEQKFMSRYKLT